MKIIRHIGIRIQDDIAFVADIFKHHFGMNLGLVFIAHCRAGHQSLSGVSIEWINHFRIAVAGMEIIAQTRVDDHRLMTFCGLLFKPSHTI